jgi:hypothetical protein
MVEARQGGSELDFADAEKSLDRSAGSVFRNLFGTAEVEYDRRARSTDVGGGISDLTPFGELRENDHLESLLCA